MGVTPEAGLLRAMQRRATAPENVKREVVPENET
jgi:hypothetical protein